METLETWLNWIQSLSVVQIDLCLDRVRQVGRRLSVLNLPHFVITVGGTNGKGSTVAALEAIFNQANYSVASFTSPYFFEFNEQIRINSHPVATDCLLTAFKAVDDARGDIPLTPFEFTTLAALVVFKTLPKGILILEVGLGGRLDAVNAVEPNVSIVTSVALDHMDYLGQTREEIAFEKAGVFRCKVPAVSGDPVTPQRLRDYAALIKAPLFCQKEDFGYQVSTHQWDWWTGSETLVGLPIPKLALQNWSTVLMAISLIQSYFPVSRDVIETVMASLTVPGRLQVMPGSRQFIYDVAHNPAAVKLLCDFIVQQYPNKSRYAIFSMLADKDIKNAILQIRDEITHWFVAPLAVPRGASLQRLQQTFQDLGVLNVNFFADLKAAQQAAIQMSVLDDILVHFGSFYTVSSLVNRP